MITVTKFNGVTYYETPYMGGILTKSIEIYAGLAVFQISFTSGDYTETEIIISQNPTR